MSNDLTNQIPCLIGGAIPIASGEDAEAMEKTQMRQWIGLLSGGDGLEIPLNGGSDTRRGIRECWEERCKAMGINCQNIGGHTLIIGGRCEYSEDTK